MYMNLLEQFKSSENVGRIQTTLFEIALRDCANNPEYYNKTEIKDDLNALNFLLSKIQEIPLPENE